MLEIPEALTMARQLNHEVKGKTIVDVVAAQSPHGFAWYYGEPALYRDLLAGKTVDGVHAAGGQVELTIGDSRLNFNDGVNIRLLAPGAPPPKKHQLLVTFDDGSAIVCTVQMYGGLMAFPAGGSDDNLYYTVSREKPGPLSEAFDEAYFESLFKQAPAKLSAKALLATEQRIPGLGNGCLQDILWNARINPQMKLAVMDDRHLRALFDSVKRTLTAMADGGGRDTEKDLYGNPGGYLSVLSAKTAAYACPHCGGGITRKTYMGGNVYFCIACQPL